MRIKRWVAGVFSAVFLVSIFGGCDMFTPQFMDYNVSGYINALLDSSYKGEHEDFINFTQSSESEAESNHRLTVENGAVYFCNAFGIYPSDEQMEKIEEFVRTAYEQTSYTVKTEVKTDTGYTVDIDITPLVTFRELTDDFEQALNDIQYGALDMSGVDEDETAEEDGDEEAEEYDDGDEGSETSESSESDGNTIDQYELFVDEVIRICQNALSEPPEYDQSTTITMNILLEDDGVLYMDRTQLEQIDVTVILFATK